MRSILLALCFSLSAVSFGKDKALEVYFVDVEGGQATLAVSPSGESLLIDTGWPGFEGRDARRIVAAAHEAGIKQIDYLLVTHYHMDHVGGVPQLAERIPIRAFLDHGPSADSGERAEALMAAYRSAIAKARHEVVKPGDEIPIKGLEVKVLTAAGEVLQVSLPGGGKSNPHCASTKPIEDAQGENPQSAGILIRYGKFRFIDLGDLTWNKELALVCPDNRLGNVDVYLSTHHGNEDSGSPAIVRALAPRVAIVPNGARKGGTPAAWRVMRSSPGLEDIWQLHRSVEGGEANNAPEKFIANPAERCEGRAIKLTADADGSFTVTNTRNGFSKQYRPR
ncbi:MAG: ComEC/Rec2 family competence protein [Terriglobia bacterium]